MVVLAEAEALVQVVQVEMLMAVQEEQALQSGAVTEEAPQPLGVPRVVMARYLAAVAEVRVEVPVQLREETEQTAASL